VSSNAAQTHSDLTNSGAHSSSTIHLTDLRSGSIPSCGVKFIVKQAYPKDTSRCAPEPTDAYAWAVIDAIPRSLAHRVTFALCDSSGILVSRQNQDMSSVAGMTSVANEWRLEQLDIAEQLLKAYPDTVETLSFLEERIEAIRLAQDSHANLHSWVS
jgi:hypothetical protein